MGFLTPSFLFDMESRMQLIQEREFTRLAAAENLWWDKIAKTRTTGSRKEAIQWLLSTVAFEDIGKKGGTIAFADMMAAKAEYEPSAAGTGLKLHRYQLEDLDGNGLDLAAEWASQVGSYSAYWPQKQIAALLKTGETLSSSNPTYDGVAFFSQAHPLLPGETGSPTFANLFTGATAGMAACPIDASVTTDVALANLGKAFAQIAALVMPNGQDPRFLVPRRLFVPTKMVPRAQQLTGSKYLAQAAASGGGSADVEPILRNWGMEAPVEVQELNGFEGDTTYFIGVEQIAASQLGALAYIEREAFATTYYTGRGGGTGVDALLDRADELEWHCKGRNKAVFGHPYLLFKCKGT